MLIESDIILAYVKEEDWLREYSLKLLKAAEDNKLELYVSREIIHELYYLARRYNIDLHIFLEKIVALTRINNLRWIPTDIEIDLTALTLMIEYEINSIFDAYYAATALLRDPDKIIISTDEIYDKIPGIKRIDPREVNI